MTAVLDKHLWYIKQTRIDTLLDQKFHCILPQNNKQNSCCPIFFVLITLKWVKRDSFFRNVFIVFFHFFFIDLWIDYFLLFSYFSCFTDFFESVILGLKEIALYINLYLSFYLPKRLLLERFPTKFRKIITIL